MEIHQHRRASSGVRRRFSPSPTRPLDLLRLCPFYKATPLRNVDALAKSFGIAKLWLKDESDRLGLGSFKALGGAFAVAQMILDAAEEALGERCFADDLTSARVQALATGTTFITGSAGNHGLSVAAGATLFGARAVIVLPETAPVSFAERLEALGATVERVPGVYEDSVAYAIATAETKGWQLLADSSWPGYTRPPALVMEGYSVLAEECRTAFDRAGEWPTHVFLQGGVGGLAGAVAAQIREHWSEQPNIIVVEPDAAPCLLHSVRAGVLTRASGPVSTMGRLDCKDASLIAFEALTCDADVFMTISDDHAQIATQRLAALNVETTPSGAAGVAALHAARELGIGPRSRCLAIITEQAWGQ